MSSSRSSVAPWPAQTPLTPPLHTGKRKRSGMEVHARAPKFPRATIANQSQIEEAMTECFDSDNSVISCWPTNATIIEQDDSSAFIWNSRLPSFTQFNLVDIVLFRADTGQIVQRWNSTTNPSNRAGSLPITTEDEWWGSQGPSWDGSPTPFPFYFAVVPSGTPVASGQPQSTFTAVQTTFPASVIASMSSASVAAASSSAAAASSSSLHSTQTSGGLTSSTSGGNVQDASSNSPFPRWAIAVIVILGFLALAALVALIFLVIARARRRRYDPSRRGSMGSQSPMMANMADPQQTGPLSPQMETGEAGHALGAGILGGAVAGRAASSVAPENDGASSTSENLFSGADAAVMAEAFRKALRKPEFADQTVEEGESPEAISDHPELLSRELAEEGRDIRSVGSSRDVRVETLSDDGADTATATRLSTPRNSTG